MLWNLGIWAGEDCKKTMWASSKYCFKYLLMICFQSLSFVEDYQDFKSRYWIQVLVHMSMSKVLAWHKTLVASHMVYCQSPAPAPVCGEVAMLAPVWSEADWGTQVTSSSRHGTSPASADACKHLSCFIPITIFIKHRTNVSNKFVSFICPVEADLQDRS